MERLGVRMSQGLFTLLSLVACVQIQVGGERKTETGTFKTEKTDEKPDSNPDRKSPDRLRDK
jgi:hypothetical protein